MLELLILILIIVVLYTYMPKNKTKKISNTENFSNADQIIMTNKNGIANAMEFGDEIPNQILKKDLPELAKTSSDDGYSKNNLKDTYTVNGYRWTKEDTNNFNIDEIQQKMTDEEMRNSFKNMYMLDPTGELSKYDVSNMPISKYCCPAVYRNPSGGMDDIDPIKACEYANKYVANGYSGMNFNDGLGCVCMTPSDAAFYSARGGNTTI